MSDEERLERIIRESKGVVWNTETDEDLLTELDTPDFNWLIEQAEQVQELEETNKKNYWIAADFKFENLKLEQQNKRYREVLNRISITTKEGTTYRWARRALEESE